MMERFGGFRPCPLNTHIQIGGSGVAKSKLRKKEGERAQAAIAAAQKQWLGLARPHHGRHGTLWVPPSSDYELYVEPRLD